MPSKERTLSLRSFPSGWVQNLAQQRLSKYLRNDWVSRYQGLRRQEGYPEDSQVPCLEQGVKRFLIIQERQGGGEAQNLQTQGWTEGLGTRTMSRLGMVTFLYYPMLFLPCGVSHQGCLLELPRELLKLSKPSSKSNQSLEVEPHSSFLKSPGDSNVQPQLKTPELVHQYYPRFTKEVLHRLVYTGIIWRPVCPQNHMPRPNSWFSTAGKDPHCVCVLKKLTRGFY